MHFVTNIHINSLISFISVCLYTAVQFMQYICCVELLAFHSQHAY
jgi:hypothetical protein